MVALVQQTAKYDVVIPYKTPSNFSEEELRYTLRSIAKNFLSLRNVYIIGDCPNWVKRVIHIPTSQGYSKVDNVRAAHSIAVTRPEISDNFVLWSDDIYLLRPIQQIPLWHGGPLGNFLNTFKNRYLLSYYTSIIERTTNVVPGELPHWELHIPVVMNKESLSYILETYGGRGLLGRTLYGNIFHEGSGQYHQDVKLYRVEESKGWQTNPRYDTFVSSDDSTFYKILALPLANQFPDPCKFEDSV